MLLNDNETSIDLLNNRTIAKAIVKTMLDSAPEPVTIGVHGDWGAGKSSVLRMIADDLSEVDGVACLHFNGWLFQGFEDAKIVLIEKIVHDLLAKQSTSSKVKAAAGSVLKKLDWLRVAKHAGGLAWTAFSGVPLPGQLEEVTNILKGLIPSEASDVSVDDVKAAIEHIGSAVKEPESRHISKEIIEFRDEFAELLKASKIKQLVVLIDDLDRCLPETAIDILEALRLFLLIPCAAFVIAADEQMIEYSVRRHFPDLPHSEKAQNYTRNYLEKLINIPFRLPQLGVAETKIYVTLLLLMSHIGPKDEKFISLSEKGVELMNKPWECDGFQRKDIDEVLGADVDSDLNSCFALANEIGKTLAKGAKGNPRQIKRFLNAYVMRSVVADARGLSAYIKSDVLAKMMLAERFVPDVYDVVSVDVSSSEVGDSVTINLMEKFVSIDVEDDAPKWSEQEDRIIEKFDNQAARDWFALMPPLSGVDLRPYLFVARDSQKVIFDGVSRSKVEELSLRLLGNKVQIAQCAAEIKSLDSVQVKELVGILRDKVLGVGAYIDEPSGIGGFRTLASIRVEAREGLLGVLEQMPVDKVGRWVVVGWNKCFSDLEHRKRLLAVLEELEAKGIEQFRAAFSVGVRQLKKTL